MKCSYLSTFLTRPAYFHTITTSINLSVLHISPNGFIKSMVVEINQYPGRFANNYVKILSFIIISLQVRQVFFTTDENTKPRCLEEIKLT